MQLNIPSLNGEVVGGMQHKYQETVLFFRAGGRPATPTAVTVFAGRSLSAMPT